MNPVSSRVFSAQMAHFHLALALHLLEGVWLSHPPSFEEIRVRFLSGAKGGLGFPGRGGRGHRGSLWFLFS